MPHLRADLLWQIPHPGEDKATCIQCPTNAGGGGGGVRALGIDGVIKSTKYWTANRYFNQPFRAAFRG